MLREAGVNLDAASPWNGATPAHEAAAFGHVKFLERGLASFPERIGFGVYYTIIIMTNPQSSIGSYLGP